MTNITPEMQPGKSGNAVVLDRARLTYASASGDGTHLELATLDNSGPLFNPLLSFREDEQLGLQVVIHLADKDVVLPLSDLKQAIAEAESEVHKESFYDQRDPAA